MRETSPRGENCGYLNNIFGSSNKGQRNEFGHRRGDIEFIARIRHCTLEYTGTRRQVLLAKCNFLGASEPKLLIFPVTAPYAGTTRT